ncbi:MAG: helix-turn-helix domain-containing protein [Lachnospiraceae bacterium]|nr:helix-turn-helix domain-containing protein [Lachnospiraceae bacterium]
MNKEEQSVQKKRFSQIWLTSRTDAGKTQEFMAMGLGVSTKTVQNWENGITSPDLFMGSEWFRVLGVNPLPYYLSYLFPDLFEGLSPENDDDAIDQALMALIRNSTAVEKRELLFLMAGRHGSPWYSLLQLFTAHCHTSMQSRVTAARSVLDSYEMDAAAGRLVCPSNVKPDIAFLKNAIEEGKKAVIAGKAGYTNVIETNGVKKT